MLMIHTLCKICSMDILQWISRDVQDNSLIIAETELNLL